MTARTDGATGRGDAEARRGGYGNPEQHAEEWHGSDGYCDYDPRCPLLGRWAVVVNVAQHLPDGSIGECWSDEVATFDGVRAADDVVPFAAALRHHAYNLREGDAGGSE